MSFPVPQSQGLSPARWNPGLANANRPSAWPTAAGSNVVWVNFKRKNVDRAPNSSDAAAHLSGIAFQPVFDELEEFEGLDAGWDGPGSKTASPESLKAACEFVRKLSAWAIVPEVSLASDGEISVYWNSAESYVDVSFQRSGRASIYARIEGRIYKSDSASAASLHVPAPIVSHLAPL